MKRDMWMLAAAVVFAGGVLAQAADIVTNDANLASPNATTANDSSNPAFYNGSGNPNGGFTVDNNNGIEIGLRAKYRQNPAVINSSNNVYSVVAGPQTNTTSGGNGASATHASWTYDFSIDLQPNHVGALTLGDITATLTIQDLTQSTSATVNPLTHWTDDSGYGANGLGATKTAKDSPQTANDWGVQNSEGPQFGDFPLAGGYNMNATDDYEFTLTVDEGSNQLATDTIFVNVVPLPASAWSGLALLGGLAVVGGIKRARRQIA